MRLFEISNLNDYNYIKRINGLIKLKERRSICGLWTKIQDFQNKVNFLSDARRFYDPETASSSGASHVPSQPLTIPSSRTMPCRDSGLPHNTRNIMGTSGSGFESLPDREGPHSVIFENSRNLASSLRLRPERIETRVAELDESRRIRRYLHHASNEGLEMLIIRVELILTMI